jgi:hypothetical protein
VNAGKTFRRAGLVALLLVTAASACGDGGGDRLSKAEYEAQALSITRDLNAPASRLFSDIVTYTYPRATCADKTRRFRAVLAEVVERVEALRPPKDVADLQRRFLVAAEKSVRQVAAAAADVERGRLACGEPLNRRIYGLPSTDRAAAILVEYQRRGYFPFLGGE